MILSDVIYLSEAVVSFLLETLFPSNLCFSLAMAILLDLSTGIELRLSPTSEPSSDSVLAWIEEMLCHDGLSRSGLRQEEIERLLRLPSHSSSASTSVSRRLELLLQRILCNELSFGQLVPLREDQQTRLLLNRLLIAAVASLSEGRSLS